MRTGRTDRGTPPDTNVTDCCARNVVVVWWEQTVVAGDIPLVLGGVSGVRVVRDRRSSLLVGG